MYWRLWDEANKTEEAEAAERGVEEGGPEQASSSMWSSKGTGLQEGDVSLGGSSCRSPGPVGSLVTTTGEAGDFVSKEEGSDP